jgi:pimeloyl-ACP methyl ester carboxylesterase
MQPQTVRFIQDALGNRIAYAEVGAGPLLICPAWWVSHVESDWALPRFREFFTRLGTSFRVIRYDRPGMGLSDRDVPSRTFHDEVRLLETVAEHVGVHSDEQNVSLLGISAGGPVALAYAARYPARVRRICCFGTYANGADLASPKLRDAMIALTAAHWGVGSKVLTDMFVPDASAEEVELILRSHREWASAASASDLLRVMFSYDVRHCLSAIQAEILVLHRQGDRGIPMEAGRKLAAALPKARFISFPGNNHPPWFDDEGIAEIIRLFLTGVEPSTVPTPSTTNSNGACSLDEANRALVVAGARADTTPLEWGVISLLVERAGRIVTRDELLAQVWKTPYSGSNKVEAVIRTLRKKLGPFAPSIETVTGHGYRFSGWRRD